MAGLEWYLEGIKLADDCVISHIKCWLKKNGYSKNKSFYLKKLIESLVKIEIQNNSYDKSQHYINVTIYFDQKTIELFQLKNDVGVWVRLESLNADRKIEYLNALNAKSEISDKNRFQLIDSLFDSELLFLLDHWSTFKGAEVHFRGGYLKHQAVSQELKIRWSHVTSEN